MKKMSFTKKMMIALAGGLITGLIFLMLREYLTRGGNEVIWQTINNILFQDISVEAGRNSFGIFYIIGQIFINSLQLVLVPLVFTSIILAICHIHDTQKLGRISYKTFKNFLLITGIALLLGGSVGYFAYYIGLFNVEVVGDIVIREGQTSANPLMVLVQAMTNNVAASFTNNSAIIAVVVLAIMIGIVMNTLGDAVVTFKKLVTELNLITMTFLTFVITKVGPFAIFILLTRTFAAYGIEYLKPAAIYMIITTITSLVFLFIIMPLVLGILTKLNPIIFIKKMMKVAMFGFSTSSSAATLPLNTKTVIEELGVSPDITAFVVPLSTAINMTGTAIMQVIASLFIAGVAQYTVTPIDLLMIILLAFIGSISTPAAPGAGAIILFTVISGLGYNSAMALTAYSLILAINRPIEMLSTAINVVDSAFSAVSIGKSENLIDEKIYNNISGK